LSSQWKHESSAIEIPPAIHHYFLPAPSALLALKLFKFCKENPFGKFVSEIPPTPPFIKGGQGGFLEGADSLIPYIWVAALPRCVFCGEIFPPADIPGSVEAKNASIYLCL
jgi:hypothetical protein